MLLTEIFRTPGRYIGEEQEIRRRALEQLLRVEGKSYTVIRQTDGKTAHAFLTVLFCQRIRHKQTDSQKFNINCLTLHTAKQKTVV